MKLTTIWSPSMKGYPLRERLSRTSEWLWAAAGRAVPDRLAYWVLIAQGVKHISGPGHEDEIVPEVPLLTVVQRMQHTA